MLFLLLNNIYSVGQCCGSGSLFRQPAQMHRLGLVWIKCTLSMLFAPRIHWGCIASIQFKSVMCLSNLFYKATFIVRIQIQEGQNSPPKKKTRRDPVLKYGRGLLLECFNCLHGVVIKYCVVMVAQNLDLDPQHWWLTLFCFGRSKDDVLQPSLTRMSWGSSWAAGLGFSRASLLVSIFPVLHTV